MERGQLPNAGRHDVKRVRADAAKFERMCAIVEDALVPIMGRHLVDEAHAVTLPAPGFVTEVLRLADLEGSISPAETAALVNELEGDLGPVDPDAEDVRDAARTAARLLMSTWIDIIERAIAAASGDIELGAELCPTSIAAEAYTRRLQQAVATLPLTDDDIRGALRELAQHVVKGLELPQALRVRRGAALSAG